jgi:hypothetical protein
MKILLITGLTSFLVFLSGCTTTRFLGTAIGAEGFDEVLITAELGVCDLSSSGSVRRRYDTPEKYQAWQDFCMMIEGIRLHD